MATDVMAGDNAAPAAVPRFFRDGVLEFGGDYNPEQWPRETWSEDVRLMREAGVTLVAINVFGWAQIERSEGEYDFGALDEVIELLHANGIGINLGTGTASPPPWLTRMHPEILPEADDGTTRWPGGRQAWCPHSGVFRRYALALVRATASRYGRHPAVRLWHVSNELGCHNALCYDDESASAFRVWLEHRYASIDALNEAWGTAFWSQRYGSFDDVLPPRRTLSVSNPTQVLDFNRFSSDALLDYYRAELAVLRELSDAPVTTNFMVTMHIRNQDYWSWAPHMDVVANDHYLDHRLGQPHLELSFAADLTRGLAAGSPWLLMEQATGAVNWQHHNVAKAPGEMIRNSLTHVARGADGVCFFQWRASDRGSEKYHSGMIPHAGTDSNTWREVRELGRILRAIGEVAGSRVIADVAILFDWNAWWACDLDSRPSSDVRYIEQVHAAYGALFAAGVTADIVQPGTDLTGYKLVVVPALYLVTDAAAAALDEYVSAGGHALVTFFSGIVDQDDRVRLGGYPGAFRDLLGIRTQEFFPLLPGQQTTLSDGSRATMWTEWTSAEGAEVVASYTDGPLAGSPAITRNRRGEGVAWYVGTWLDEGALHALVARIAQEAGAASASPAGGVEVVRRQGSQYEYEFVINHTSQDILADGHGIELVEDRPIDSQFTVPAGAVRVLRRDLTGPPEIDLR